MSTLEVLCLWIVRSWIFAKLNRKINCVWVYFFHPEATCWLYFLDMIKFFDQKNNHCHLSKFVRLRTRTLSVSCEEETWDLILTFLWSPGMLGMTSLFWASVFSSLIVRNYTKWPLKSLPLVIPCDSRISNWP